MPRADIDWEAIERDFRLGRGSVREIAKRYGVGHQSILRHAAKGKWTQDKAPEVNRRVAERLLLSGPRRTKRTTETDQGESGPHGLHGAGGGLTEADIEATVDERVEVLREHQRVGRDFRKTLTKLRRELDEVSEHRDEIADAIEDETRDDKTVDRRKRMLRAVSLPARAQAAAVLTGGFKNAVGIERQAHGLADGNDAVSPDDAPLIIERRIIRA
jgi:hypothetical protein